MLIRDWIGFWMMSIWMDVEYLPGIMNMIFMIKEGAAAAPGTQILLQRKATVGEEHLLLPESLSQRGEVSTFFLLESIFSSIFLSKNTFSHFSHLFTLKDAVEALSSVVAVEEAVAEVDIWTGTRRGPMLTLWRRRPWARTRPSRRRRP